MGISVVLCVMTPTAFLQAMTEFSIKTLRLHADNDFELVVVEANGNHFDSAALMWAPDAGGAFSRFEMTHDKTQNHLVACPDKYLNFTPGIGCVKELNLGLQVASGSFIVTTGNDVIPPPHWDTELLRCFEERKDCAVASLSAFEPGAIVGPPQAQDRIVEGMYSPFMMFRAGEVFDEEYIKIYQDSDFVMRVYERGQRAYRSCRAHVHHLCRMTSDRVAPKEHDRQLAHDERLFYQKWGKSPLAMFGLIRYGVWTYGQEHASLTQPINLHY